MKGGCGDGSRLPEDARKSVAHVGGTSLCPLYKGNGPMYAEHRQHGEVGPDNGTDLCH